MSETTSPASGSDDSTAKSNPAPAAPAVPPVDEAPAEATTRLVLVPDAFTEAFVAYVEDVGQIRIDKHGADVPSASVEAIIAQAEASSLVVKEA